MGQWARTFFPILCVIEEEGRMKFDDLSRILIQKDNRRFKSLEQVKYAIETLTRCLQIDGDEVLYDAHSPTYTREGASQFERTIQIELHGILKNSGVTFNWKLYPFLARNNSNLCYMGVPWKEIPEKGENRVDDGCNFRNDKDSCTFGCGVERNIVEKYLNS